MPLAGRLPRDALRGLPARGRRRRRGDRSGRSRGAAARRGDPRAASPVRRRRPVSAPGRDQRLAGLPLLRQCIGLVAERRGEPLVSGLGRRASGVPAAAQAEARHVLRLQDQPGLVRRIRLGHRALRRLRGPRARVQPTQVRRAASSSPLPATAEVTGPRTSNRKSTAAVTLARRSSTAAPIPAERNTLVAAWVGPSSSRRYGSCLSNEALRRAKLDEMKRFAAAVEPGFMYIRDIDSGTLRKARRAGCCAARSAGNGGPATSWPLPRARPGALAAWYRQDPHRTGWRFHAERIPARDLTLIFTRPLHLLLRKGTAGPLGPRDRLFLPPQPIDGDG